jgi:hypothetical protein
MDAAELMKKLIKLERAIGVTDVVQLRNLVMDAQVALLEMQRHSVTALQTAIHREAAARPHTVIPDWREIALSTGRKPPVSENRAELSEFPLRMPVRSLAKA